MGGKWVLREVVIKIPAQGGVFLTDKAKIYYRLTGEDGRLVYSVIERTPMVIRDVVFELEKKLRSSIELIKTALGYEGKELEELKEE